MKTNGSISVARLGRLLIAALCLYGTSVQAGPFTSLTNRLAATMSSLPRYEKLPLFDPHRRSFTCLYQDQRVPVIDPQAEAWFQQALALDSPDIYYKERDYPKIYQLYLQAAGRNHWKAMLNLASLIVSGYPGVPEQDPERAIGWVEKAMRLGVPDAYDMMGTYHQNGMVRGGDATSAYAFFQRAADMGSPSAMTFLGYKMAGTYDDPGEGFWGNLAVAVPMLECALAQGDGDAAEKLGFIYARPETPEAKLRALKVLHEGVKLGSAECASKLSIEFDGFNLTSGRNLPGHIDEARSERYSTLARALEFYQGRLKLPNLDKILPLPPAPLPKWDGSRQTLIDAAKAVTLPPPKTSQSTTWQTPADMTGHYPTEARQLPPGREVFLTQMLQAGLLRLVSPPESRLICNGVQRCPQTGIWEGRVAADHPLAGLYNRWEQQAFVEAGQSFPEPRERFLDIASESVRWIYHGSPNADADAPGVKKITL